MSAPVVTTFERVSELPLTIEELLARRPRARRQPRVHARHDDVPPARRRRGGPGRGRHLRPRRAARAAGPRPVAPARRRVDVRGVRRATSASSTSSPPARPTCPPSCSTAAGRSRAPALDLALRQAGRSLGDVLGREHRPVSFVVSLRLGNPPSFEPVGQRLEVYPWLRFKLDGTPDWPGELIEQLVETGAIASIDFKGAYKGTAVDVETDPALLPPHRRGAARRLARGPRPDRPRGRRRARAPPRPHHLGRADPLGRRHRGARLPAQDGQRQAVALRLGRGAVRRLRLLRGQGHRDVRRRPDRARRRAAGRSRCLASLFHPDGVNDIAPSGYDWAEFLRDLEPSPLDPRPEPTGMRRRT